MTLVVPECDDLYRVVPNLSRLNWFLSNAGEGAHIRCSYLFPYVSPPTYSFAPLTWGILMINTLSIGEPCPQIALIAKQNVIIQLTIKLRNFKLAKGVLVGRVLLWTHPK